MECRSNGTKNKKMRIINEPINTDRNGTKSKAMEGQREGESAEDVVALTTPPKTKGTGPAVVGQGLAANAGQRTQRLSHRIWSSIGIELTKHTKTHSVAVRHTRSALLHRVQFSKYIVCSKQRGRAITKTKLSLSFGTENRETLRIIFEIDWYSQRRGGAERARPTHLLILNL